MKPVPSSLLAGGAALLIGGLFLLTPFKLLATSLCICDNADGTQAAFVVDNEAECDSHLTAGVLQCLFIPEGSSGSTGNPSGNKSTGNPGGGGPTSLDCPLGDPTVCKDPRILIGNVIRVVLGIVGSLALIIFIYGGLMWMTSSGNTERIKKGRDTLVWAVIGLMIIFGSYAVVNFVIQGLTKP